MASGEPSLTLAGLSLVGGAFLDPLPVFAVPSPRP